MSERPILMSGEFVRAVLDGRKSQTRRPINPQPFWTGDHWRFEGKPAAGFNSESCMRDMLPIYCPFGKIGDWLWVRETWRTDPCYNHIKPSELKQHWPIYYADQITHGYHKVRQSIFMPRWASRITLELTEVRVERVQEISGEDAVAEGVMKTAEIDPAKLERCEWVQCCGTATHIFRQLWEKVYPGSWESDPWVWVLCFKRVEAAHA